MRTREVAEICGVSIPTVTENAKKIGKEIKNGVPTDWTEDEVKELQLVLMENQTSQGVQVDLVKNEALNRFKAGLSLQVIMQSGNMEACKELCQMITEGTKAQHNLLLEQQKNKELEAQNQLLIEQKKVAEAETARIYQYNKNFHSNLYTATDLAKILGTTANMIGRIANEQHLKQEPLYGKLGKIQLNNGRWCDIFYYNDDAKTVIENNL